MTSGIFLGSNLPSVITDEIEDDWRREIAEDFLDVNLLCGPEVTARLLQDGQLECWELYIENVTSLCKFMIHFSPTSKHLVNIDIKTKDLKVHKRICCHPVQQLQQYLQLCPKDIFSPLIGELELIARFDCFRSYTGGPKND